MHTIASQPSTRNMSEFARSAHKLFSNKNAQKMAKNGKNKVRARMPALVHKPSPGSKVQENIEREKTNWRD